jgi:microcystin-dependent protein
MGRTLGVDADESYTNKATELRTLNPEAVAQVGGAQAHSNMGPFLGVNFIIAMVGTYPRRQ